MGLFVLSGEGGRIVLTRSAYVPIFRSSLSKYIDLLHLLRAFLFIHANKRIFVRVREVIRNSATASRTVFSPQLAHANKLKTFLAIRHAIVTFLRPRRNPFSFAAVGNASVGPRRRYLHRSHPLAPAMCPPSISSRMDLHLMSLFSSTVSPPTST